MTKELNKDEFNKVYEHYKKQGLTNKDISKKLDMSIRSLYYYKKGVVPTKETVITKKVHVKFIVVKKIKRVPQPTPQEMHYLLRCRCRVKDESDYKKDKTFNKVHVPGRGTLTEHYFTWVGSYDLSGDFVLIQAKKVHKRWLNHELIELKEIERG